MINLLRRLFALKFGTPVFCSQIAKIFLCIILKSFEQYISINDPHFAAKAPSLMGPFNQGLSNESNQMQLKRIFRYSEIFCVYLITLWLLSQGLSSFKSHLCMVYQVDINLIRANKHEIEISKGVTKGDKGY